MIYGIVSSMEERMISRTPDIKLWCGQSHWSRVTHICVSKLTIVGSDNGLLLGRGHATIWSNAWMLLIGPFEQISVKSLSQCIHSRSRNCIWKFRLGNGGKIVSASMWYTWAALFGRNRYFQWSYVLKWNTLYLTYDGLLHFSHFQQISMLSYILYAAHLSYSN